MKGREGEALSILLKMTGKSLWNGRSPSLGIARRNKSTGQKKGRSKDGKIWVRTKRGEGADRTNRFSITHHEKKKRNVLSEEEKTSKSPVLGKRQKGTIDANKRSYEGKGGLCFPEGGVDTEVFCKGAGGDASTNREPGKDSGKGGKKEGV